MVSSKVQGKFKGTWFIQRFVVNSKVHVNVYDKFKGAKHIQMYKVNSKKRGRFSR